MPYLMSTNKMKMTINKRTKDHQHRRIFMARKFAIATTAMIAASAISVATFPMIAHALGEEKAHVQLQTLGEEKYALQKVLNLCRGGDGVDISSANHDKYSSTKLNKEENNWPGTDPFASNVITNAYDQSPLPADHSSQVVNAGRIRLRKKQQTPTPEISEENDDEPQAQIVNEQSLQSVSFTPRPRLVIEFDTQAVGGGFDHTKSIRNRIRSRIGTDNEWNRLSQNRGPVLSVSFDAFSPPPSPSVMQQQEVSQYQNVGNININSDQQSTFLNNIITPTATAIILVTQTAALLPSLLISRRVLNTTWTAIVDYIRGRVVRTTFTNLERAYLRYYEFPAVTRATARLVSQIGILIGLSWAVRWWMIWVLMDNAVGPMVMGVTGIDVGMVGAAGGKFPGKGWKVGLPCHQRGKGMAWLCGFFWVVSVVGIGHACAMALSVWGGPLRLQAIAQQAEKPKAMLRRIVHHPIVWIKGMEEWKYMSIDNFAQRRDRRKGGKVRSTSSREHAFNPDPILFPSTWLPLRWLQIFAVAKAFSTDPLQYRWCSPDDSKVVIPRLMKQYLIQLALGDEWHRVFLGEKRVGLGIMVVLSYFIALLVMVFTAFTLDGGSAAMLIPSVLAAIMSGFMNIAIFWNRMGTNEQRRALQRMGLA